eukprot:maker-scaffold_16-snap-gene-3.10-mRNA-1 protein AED:0.03 eAED:0.03 QI:61/0.5/0.66/1/0.5/0.33/3/97/271
MQEMDQQFSKMKRWIWLGENIKPHYDKLKTFKSGSVKTEVLSKSLNISISNPARRNALSGSMMTELCDIVHTMIDSNIITLRGAEKVGFCSGADLSMFKADMRKEHGTAMCSLMQYNTFNILQLPQVSCSIIDRFAVGGGTELSLATDFRIMHKDAFFQMVQGNMGLTPGWGGGKHLVELIGKHNAVKILVGGERLTAQQCFDIGLVDKLFEKEDELEEFLERFRDQKFADSSLMNKKVILANSYHKEKEIFESLWLGKSNLQALSSVSKQ